MMYVQEKPIVYIRYYSVIITYVNHYLSILIYVLIFLSFVQVSQYAHYNLVITGHSLGAGTAILLTILLRSSYPNVRCYGFGTPACLDESTSLGKFIILFILDFIHNSYLRILKRLNHS